MIRAPVNGHRSLAHRRFGRVHLACGFKHPRNLNPEIAQYRRARLSRMMIQKNVVAICPQTWLAADELPDLVERRFPRRSHPARPHRSSHRGQLARRNSLEFD